MAGNRAAFDAAMKRGHNHAWDKEWMKAIEQYKLAVAEFPDDVTALSSLAFAYLKGKRFREALREYRRISQLRPGDPSPLRKLGRILEELGRSGDAARTWLTLGQLYAEQGAPRRAMEAWRDAIRLQPASKEAHKRMAEACVAGSDLAEAVREYVALARLCDKDGERAQAAEYCRRALSFDGRCSEARTLLEHLASDQEVELRERAFVLGSKELGPVDSAVQEALSSLAEAVLEEADLADAAALSAAEKGERDSLSTSQLQIATVLGKAIDAHSRGMMGDALESYERAFQMGARRVEVVFNLGLLYKQVLRFSEAVDLLQRSLEVAEYRLASHFALGECHWAEGAGDQAVKHFLEGLEAIDLDFADKDHADDITQSYRYLADSGELKGDSQTTEVFVNSLTAFFSDTDWREKATDVGRRLGSLAAEGATPILAEFLLVPRGQEVLDTMMRSQEYLKKDAPYVALEDCYRAMEISPTYVPLHLRLAEIFNDQGKVEEAVSKYAAVAETYLMRNNSRRAMEVYRRALSVAPMNISVRERLIDLLIDHDEIELALEEYLALGEGYYRLARMDDALEKYETALLLVRRFAMQKSWEIRILHRMADLHVQRIRWKEAVGIYEKIRQLSPEDERARLRLVDLRYKLGQDDVALKELDSLIVYLGKRRNFQTMIKALRELVDSKPQDIPLRSRLGRICVEAGMKEEAIAELDTLGELQLEAGRKSDAMDTLRTIISLKPKEKDGYTQLLRELSEESK